MEKNLKDSWLVQFTPVPVWLTLGSQVLFSDPRTLRAQNQALSFSDSFHLKKLWIKLCNSENFLSAGSFTGQPQYETGSWEQIYKPCASQFQQVCKSTSATSKHTEKKKPNQNKQVRIFVFAFITIYSSIIVAFSRSKWGVKTVFVIAVAHTYTE